MKYIHVYDSLMFDPRLLQAFVEIVDAGSFTAAAHRLNSTQSTLSQQISRLENAVRFSLFDRSARPVTLTPAGERLIGYARRILALQNEAAALLTDPSGSRSLRVGLPDDLMTSAICHAFAQFTTSHPEIRLDVTTGLSRDLAHRFREGELDIALVKEPQAQSDARASFREPLAWVEAAGRTQPWTDPIPMVTFPPGGLYRDQMIEMIEVAKSRWYLAFTGNSLMSVLRAVEAGLGVSVLPLATIDAAKVQICRQFEPIPPMALSVYAWDQDTATNELVSALIKPISVDRVENRNLQAKA
ncbi:MAG: LuxR family transcriptional regulator [Novosphingobium sp. 17-62-19]|uniref:LysR family transcriptional regulator n=1 Tax=Novosphingobium sp. 17-62-19 TaxID=1970406 RepID=UPI000BD383D5|nr:LysR family transcriptional regulator [Novosphingobium sp. 17-62-19]OYX94481.1 MAG: LuxR family transcriptional regulator [Novosphingobium sp. 35-62-5]OZA17928.1 MAG: LuxR family transcriptional regulator [Novosphingobium sp. 17-62-19]